MTNVNLFCFPFAGGDSFSYRSMITMAPPNLCIKPVELPGRGRRINDPLISDIHQLAESAYREIVPALSAPFAIYGHSMGALLGFLVAHLLIKNEQPTPLCLCLTGARGPSVVRREPVRYLMSDEQFKAELKALGGISDEVLENDQLMHFYNAILRSDFKAVENYKHEQCAPLSIPITVIIGTEENIEHEDAAAWQKETTANVKILKFPGDHFFIHKYPKEIIATINADLQTLAQ